MEYIPQEVFNKIRDKSITHNIFRIKDNESIMCGFCCMAFIEYMLVEKAFLYYTNLFSPNDYKKMTKQYINISRINMSSLEFRLKNR